MIIVYLILGIVGLWILWSITKVSAGAVKMKTDPIGTGVLYLKQHLKSRSPEYLELIPDAVFKELAELADSMADMSHEIHNEAKVTEYVQSLEHFVIQIDGIMKGLSEVQGIKGGDPTVVKKLKAYGVQIPHESKNGSHNEKGKAITDAVGAFYKGSCDIHTAYTQKEMSESEVVIADAFLFGMIDFMTDSANMRNAHTITAIATAVLINQFNEDPEVISKRVSDMMEMSGTNSGKMVMQKGAEALHSYLSNNDENSPYMLHKVIEAVARALNKNE